MFFYTRSKDVPKCLTLTLIKCFLCLLGNIDSNATLIKLPTNQATIATEITGLEINSGVISIPYFCSWTVQPGLTGGFQFYQPSFGGCTPPTIPNYSISCFESSGVVSSNLTFLTPLTSNVSVVMSCSSSTPSPPSPPPTYNLQVIVKDCTSPTPSNVPVNPPTGVYNTPAHFQCSQNSTLFYSSGTAGNTATKCLASAEWENEKIVQCWSAPTATLIGNNTHYVGDKATFQCNAVGGFPLADRVEVYFNDQIQVLNGNTWTSTALTNLNNGNILECRAISKYTSTAEYSHLGRDKKTLTVYFGAESFKVDGDPNSNGCTWYIATLGPQSCRISFSLNPATYTTNLTKNGAIVMSDANQMQTSPSTFVFLRNKPTLSDHGVYKLRITNDKFQVDFNFNILVLNMTAPVNNPPPPNNLGVIIGIACVGVVLLILIVVLVYCLRRKRKIKMPKSVTSLDERGENGGNNLHAATSSNVDEQNNQVNNDKNKTATSSNVNEQNNQVNKGKKKKKSNKEEKVNPLYVPSDQPDQIEGAYAEVDKKKKSSKETSIKEEKVNPLYAPSDQPDQIQSAYAEVDKTKKKSGKKSNKEEKVNPLYVPSDQPDQIEGAYAEVNKKKKLGKPIKEEKVNPLYVTSDSPENVQDAYAEVVKIKKKNTPVLTPENSTTYSEVKKKYKKTASKTIPNDDNPYSEATGPANQGESDALQNELKSALKPKPLVPLKPSRFITNDKVTN